MRRLLVVSLAPTVAFAAPVEMPFQARLLDSLGVAVDGSHTVVVSLYGADDSTDLKWRTTYTNQPIEAGYLSVRLEGDDDDGDPLDSDLFAGDVWVGVKVGIDPELSLLELGTVPRAAVAVGVEGAAPGDTAGNPGTSCLALYTADNTLTDGHYWIDPDGAAATWDPTRVYCDMDNGGWTLCFDNDRGYDHVRAVLGWHTLVTTRGKGEGTYARSCKGLTAALAPTHARVAVADEGGLFYEGQATAPTLDDGAYYAFPTTGRTGTASNTIGIEIAYSGNPSAGYCHDSELDSWGISGSNSLCYLDRWADGWYDGLMHVEYWIR